jgi:aryl-alcohol dehydrogenase-like predicted oxidoreductase
MSKKKSKLCFGCEPLGGHNWDNYINKDFYNVINLALEKGINFFDTASIYGFGKSEKRLASFLGKNIKKCFISTKGGVRYLKQKKKLIIDNSPELINYNFENSLKNLKTRSIYMYSIHHVNDYRSSNFNDTLKSFDLLNKKKKLGIIKKIGCSNINLQTLKYISKHTRIDAVQLPINLLNLDRYNLFKSFCNRNKIEILPYNVLYYGFLTGKFEKFKKFKKNDRRSRLTSFKKKNFLKLLHNLSILSKKLENYNIALHHLSIQSVLNLDKVQSIIVGIKSMDQLIVNLNYINMRIKNIEMIKNQMLISINSNFKIS